MWRLLLFCLLVLADGYHLRVCVSTNSHKNHRVRMRNIIFKSLAQTSLPVAPTSRIHVHVKRKCTYQYVTDVFLWNMDDVDIKNTTIHTSNAHDALQAVVRTIVD